MANETTLLELQNLVKEFCVERDWGQFHNIKDLSLALTVEIGELLELFMWKDVSELPSLLNDPIKKEAVEDEVADILFLLLRIAQTSDINLASSLKRKIMKNAVKYPVDKARGSNKKYNEL
jgi:NTP pyrophosphatase (non-canonical NTP hydrolase)